MHHLVLWAFNSIKLTKVYLCFSWALSLHKKVLKLQKVLLCRIAVTKSGLSHKIQLTTITSGILFLDWELSVAEILSVTQITGSLFFDIYFQNIAVCFARVCMHTHCIVFIHMKELELQFPISIKICQSLDSRFQWSNNFLAKTPCVISLRQNRTCCHFLTCCTTM